MVRPTPNTAADYLLVDGLEQVTLAHESLNTSITVAHAKRSRFESTNQLTGMQPGDVLWDLAVAEVTGDITRPLPAGIITDSDGNRYVIRSVSKLVISQIWQCMTTASD